MTVRMTIGGSDVLVVIDVQNDFCPGGALAVPRGDEVVPIVNDLAARFRNVVLTQDWHPRGHLSFASSHPGKQPFETIAAPYGTQVQWPDHCVQATPIGFSIGDPDNVDLSSSPPSFPATSFFDVFTEISLDHSNDHSITIQVAPTPLPAALPLFASGLGALGLFGWRRKRKAQAVSPSRTSSLSFLNILSVIRLRRLSFGLRTVQPWFGADRQRSTCHHPHRDGGSDVRHVIFLLPVGFGHQRRCRRN